MRSSTYATAKVLNWLRPATYTGDSRVWCTMVIYLEAPFYTVWVCTTRSSVLVPSVYIMLFFDSITRLLAIHYNILSCVYMCLLALRTYGFMGRIVLLFGCCVCSETRNIPRYNLVSAAAAAVHLCCVCTLCALLRKFHCIKLWKNSSNSFDGHSVYV